MVGSRKYMSLLHLTKIKKDILVNYMGTGVNVIVPLLALPWYISLLGMNNWGLVSFIWMLQALLGILNAGVGQILVSKFSILSQQEHSREAVADLFFGFEKLYWLVSILCCLVLIISSEQIATIWLHPAGVSISDGQKVICAAGLIFLLRFPSSVYQSALFGLGYQGTYNVISAGATVVRHAFGVALLFYWANLETYLIWFVVSFLLETLVIGYASWQEVGQELFTLSWKFGKVKEVLILSLGFSFAVILGMLTLQIDKLMISWMLPIEQLGYYAIASAVGVGIVQAVDPINRSVLPIVSGMQEDQDSLRIFNFKILLVMVAIIGVIGSVYMVAGEWLLMLWLRDIHLVAVIMPVVTMLLCGSGMYAIYGIGNMNWVATGRSSRALLVNVLGLVMALITTPFMIENYQLVGATFPWLILNLIGLLMGLDWMRKRSNK